jgi:hypothetical protein
VSASCGDNKPSLNISSRTAIPLVVVAIALSACGCGKTTHTVATHTVAEDVGVPPSATECIHRWNAGSNNYTGPDPAKYKSVVIGYATPRTGGGVRRCAIVLRDSKGNYTWLVYRNSRYQRVDPAVHLTMDCRFEPDQIVTIDPTGDIRLTGNTACP